MNDQVTSRHNLSLLKYTFTQKGDHTMKQIENEVVQLIPIQIEHLEELALAANDPKIWEHMSVTLLSIEAVKAYINDAHKRYGEDFAFVIINQATLNIFIEHARLPRNILIWLNTNTINSSSIING